MGRSTFADNPAILSAGARDLDDPEVVRIRAQHGGQLSHKTHTRTRWYLKDLETAEYLADAGDLTMAAQLMKAAKKDGTYKGLLSTRTSGLVRLPKQFRGTPEIVEQLDLDAFETRSVFDQMFPATELALLVADGIELGVGVAELKKVKGRKHPILIRLDPEFLRYYPETNEWVYNSVAGVLKVTPGDGRWVLHMSGGRVAPWQDGLWKAIGRAYIRKDHAALKKDNWEGKLANPARVAVSPNGASEKQREGWFQAVGAWGINTVFGMSPGYDVKLVESNGNGHESFASTIQEQNAEIMIAVAGQTVTTDGGAGFANADIHKSIRADLIEADSGALEITINTQGIPTYIVEEFGEEALDPGAVVKWDVKPPKDRMAEATSLEKTASAVKSLTESFTAHGVKIDAIALAVRYGVPILQGEQPSPQGASMAQVLELLGDSGMKPTDDTVKLLAATFGLAVEDAPDTAATGLELTPSAQEKIATVKEGRASVGLKPKGTEEDDKTIAEVGEQAEADAEADGEVEVVEAEADVAEDATDSDDADPVEPEDEVDDAEDDADDD